MNAPIAPALLQSLIPVSLLGEEARRQAASLARHVCCPRGQAPEGFPWPRRIVYLVKGELKLDYPDGSMKVLVGGCGEAALPLVREGAVPCAARAITDVELVFFDENELDILVTWDQLVPPASGADWHALPGLFDARRLMHGVFANLPAAHIDSLLHCFRRQAVRAGEVIVRQHEPGDYYYVIERGRARVTREVGGALIELAELDAGEAFGEEALIMAARRNATVTMLTDGTLLRLDRADFVRLLQEPLLHEIDAEEAARRVAAGAIWLDVRFPAEYRQDGLPGALNIPLNELRAALPTLRRDQEYIVYCQSGRRSSAAAFLLSQRGLRASLLANGLKSMHGTVERVTK
ncbi:MAG: cyclic nucleotide-binding domain-containing protein [Rhodocyclaceae bacterium]|nr:cyclic nucleotide-binding domain-containing protein [Rhodocyclaceae bacterium]